MTTPNRPAMPDRLGLVDINWHARPGSAAEYQKQVDMYYRDFIEPLRPFIEGSIRLLGYEHPNGHWYFGDEHTRGLDTHYTYAMPPMPIEAELEPEAPSAAEVAESLRAWAVDDNATVFDQMHALADRIEKYGVRDDES